MTAGGWAVAALLAVAAALGVVYRRQIGAWLRRRRQARVEAEVEAVRRARSAALHRVLGCAARKRSPRAASRGRK